MDTNLFMNLCYGIITIFFGVLIPFGFKLLKAKLGDIKYQQLLTTIKKAVEAAQQVIGKEKCEEKKSEVMDYVINYANTFNINVTEADVDKLIEAAVYEMKNNQVEE